MCLGVPGKILDIREYYVARVDVSGNQMDISVRLTPAVEVGQYVLIHAGFAMEIIDASLANETMQAWEEIQKYRELEPDEY